MRVRCFGARGSVPVSGGEHLRYGGDTSCLEVRSSRGDLLILDAGTGIRLLGCELLGREPFDLTILFSHYHWDHIQGLPFFKPLYDPRVTLRLGGCRDARGELTRVLSRALRPPLFPVPFEKVPAKIVVAPFENESLRVGELFVRRIATSHPDRGAGFRIEENGRSLVYLTDNELSLRHRGGLSFADYAAFCRGADLLIHDAEYTPEEYPHRRGWGHSHFAEVAALAREAKVGRLGLFHHNQERTDQELDQIVERCRALLDRPGDPACEALGQGWMADIPA